MNTRLRIFAYALVAGSFLLPFSALAATLILSPADANATVGETFTETVFVSSGDQAMNAIAGTISFPADLLQVVSVSKSGSVLSLWVQDPTFSNADGAISFSGVVPNPGYTGARGRVVSVQFRGKRAGTGAISFASASQVLANDGNGTDILTSTVPATVAVNASTQAPPAPAPSSSTSQDLLAKITSSTHPDQTQWYKLSHAVFDWTNAQGVSAIRLGYDKDADGKPSVLYGEPLSHKEIDLADGIWYFHVQERGQGGWGPVSSYRVQIDTVPPVPFTIAFLNGTTTQSGGTLTVQFTTTDELSGIDGYQVAIDGKESTITADDGSRPYAVSGDAGAHMLLVRAYDKAGNSSIADGKFSVIGAEKKAYSFNLFALGWLAVNYLSLLLIILAILITLIFAAWYIRTHFNAYRYRLNRRLGLTHAHVHKEFDNLKDALMEEVRNLEQAKSKRELTREEERLVTRLKKLLDQSEQSIEKDLEDMQK